MSATDASRPVRETAPEAPLTAEELLRLENIVPEEDARPFGVQTRSARSFHLLDSSPGAGGEVSLEASELADGAFEIASRGRLVNGLPVLKGTVQSTRAHSRLARTSRWSARPRIPRQDESLPSLLPGGMPLSYHPKFLAVSGRKATRDANGRMLIRSQAQAHLLEDGDQRRGVFPDTFPLAAVCKVIVREQKMAGGPVQVSDSTGFLIGRRSMMGAGHAATDPFSFSKSIEVIPAMWAGHSVFGLGFRSFVKEFIAAGVPCRARACNLFEAPHRGGRAWLGPAASRFSQVRSVSSTSIAPVRITTGPRTRVGGMLVSG